MKFCGQCVEKTKAGESVVVLGAVPAPILSGGPKWRGNFPHGSDFPVTPNRQGW